MSNCPFCNLDSAPRAAAPKPGGNNRPTGILRRVWRRIRWFFPTVLLVLTPKCPMCVVAYVALFTGVGISVSTARWIEILMPVVCLSLLVYFAVGYLRRRGKVAAASRLR